MNLRTITCWAVYDPRKKYIFAMRQYKKQLLTSVHIPKGCLVVKVKGHYVKPRSPSTRGVAK